MGSRADGEPRGSERKFYTRHPEQTEHLWHPLHRAASQYVQIHSATSGSSGKSGLPRVDVEGALISPSRTHNRRQSFFP